MEELKDRCASDPAHIDVAGLAAAERESRRRLADTYNGLVRDIHELNGSAVRTKPTPASRFFQVKMARHADALLATGLGACNGFGISEYAAPPLEDWDGDGLRDQCEIDLFGTSPYSADSDGDGISDADEDHDNDGLTNLEEQLANGEDRCDNIDPPDAGDSDTTN